MDIVSLDSSSEEEYTYTDFAAKYKALKKQSAEKVAAKKLVPKVEEKKTAPISYSVVIDVEPKGRPGLRSQTRRQKTSSKVLEESSPEIVTRSRRSRNAHFNSSKIEGMVTDQNKIIPDKDTYNMNVKVLWRSKTVHKFSMRNDETFHKIFHYFSDLGQVSEREILLMHKDQRVEPTNTPASLQLTVIDILEAGIVQVVQREVCREDMQEDVFNIKVQTLKKGSFVIPLRKEEHFKSLLKVCSEKLCIEEANIRLYFDGELIDLEDTPESLDMEQGTCIDLHISEK